MVDEELSQILTGRTGNYSYQHQLPFTPMHLPVNPHAAQHLGQHQHPYGPRQATQSVRNCRGLSKSAAIRSDVSVRLIAQMQAIKGEFDPQEFEFYSDDDAMVGVQGIVEEILRRLDEERAKNRRLELQVRQLQSQMQQLQSSQTIQQQQPLQRSQGLYPTPYPIPEGANQFGRGLAHNPMSWEDQRRSWAAHHQRRAKLLAQALLPPSVAQPLLDANQRLMHQLTQQNDYGFGDNTTPDTNNGASSVKVEQSRGGDSSAQK